MNLGEAQKYAGFGGTRLDQRLGNERDVFITQAIERFHFEQGPTRPITRVALVSGAGHMAAIRRCLRALGYCPAQTAWMPMIGPSAEE